MILTTLKLHNFGVYAGLQTFDFSPSGGEQSVIVVGALNGCGKTTLLTAIQLVLYGPVSPNIKSERASYQEYLRSKISRGSDAKDGASVQIDFLIFDDDGERNYSVRRFWKENNRGKIREELLVCVDGEPDKFLTQNWAEHIEALLPARIVPLFFFDGEKIEELASEEKSAAILSSAVNGMLGLDLVDQLSADLDVFEFRKAKLLKSKKELLELDAAQETLKKLGEEKEALLQEKGACTAKIERQSNKLDEANTECAAQGGEYYGAQEELKLSRTDAITRFKDHAAAMASISEAAAPLLLVGDLLDDITFQADMEEMSEKAETVLELISVHDKKIVGKLTELGGESELVEELSQFLTTERQAHMDAAFKERYLNFSKSAREQLHSLNKNGLNDSAKGISKALETNTEFSDDIDRIEKTLLAVPDEEVIAPYIQAVKDAEHMLDGLHKELHVLEVQIHELDLKVGTAGRELRTQIGKGVEAQVEADDSRRFLKHSEKVKNTLAAFKQKTLQRKLSQLESLILSCFGELTRKSELIADITIDPQTYEMRLKGGDWNEIKTSDLSSGERQLLATSILWGLSKASQRQIPAIIDTPLGRLDSTHRETLCANYFPNASHQVILLSTDEEVDERYLEILRPSINRTYRVDFDAAKGGSAVGEGYLF